MKIWRGIDLKPGLEVVMALPDPNFLDLRCEKLSHFRMVVSYPSSSILFKNRIANNEYDKSVVYFGCDVSVYRGVTMTMNAASSSAVPSLRCNFEPTELRPGIFGISLVYLGIQEICMMGMESFKLMKMNHDRYGAKFDHKGFYERSWDCRKTERLVFLTGHTVGVPQLISVESESAEDLMRSLTVPMERLDEFCRARGWLK